MLNVATDTASPVCPLTVNMTVCVCGKKKQKQAKMIKKKKKNIKNTILETGTSSLIFAAG